jgi:hypothetical protein
MSGKKVLIYGGKGALGSVCVNYFKSKNFVSIIAKIKILFLIQLNAKRAKISQA